MSSKYTTEQIDAVRDAVGFRELEQATKCLGSDWAYGVADRSIKGLRVEALQRLGVDTREITGT
jgi:hypothetical protein